jgi:hypothetical protein
MPVQYPHHSQNCVLDFKIQDLLVAAIHILDTPYDDCWQMHAKTVVTRNLPVFFDAYGAVINLLSIGFIHFLILILLARAVVGSTIMSTVVTRTNCVGSVIRAT